ncbi:MAG TPA: GIDE domain-containing protein [Steroidobacteraceae bacterium]|jgi:PAS domain-containing protein|nr:GIDE domain-containing protein [Steroidobacteraceae bacterium]
MTPAWVGICVPLGMSTAAAVAGLVQWRRARAFEDTPTSKIRSAAQGYVEFCGHAHALPGDPIISPLTGRRCVWYQYRVEQRRSGGRLVWSLLDHASSDAIFALDDDTGRVVVDPAGADVTALDKEVWYGDEPDTPPRLRPPRWVGMLGGQYRYTERLILDGQLLSAVGQFQTRRPGDEPISLDTEVAVRLHAWKQDPARMAQFDVNHDGSISPEEWEQARAAARAEVLAEHREEAARPGIAFLVRPAQRRPFLLGTGSVAALATRYRRAAALLSAAALVLLVLGVRAMRS